MTPQQKEAYQEFAKEKLGFRFDDVELLITAMTHRSYVNEHKKSVSEHNERLEFLGDAVLELVATEFLYRNYSEPEGVLTSWRSALVRTESISAAGEALGYSPLVRMSRGEKNGSERARQVIVADVFEALIGAVYLERGYEGAEKFVAENILVKLDGILEEESWRDPKSWLQEIVQREDGVTPSYQVLGEDGPDHDKEFELGVFVGEKMIGRGKGSSKQAAQQEAATEAIEAYREMGKA
ncbi:ribonuclease III [Candidatus Saccharibacteria bacterium]|nr:ribonuclease III [Candidatus Saccharibacteria bacterium]